MELSTNYMGIRLESPIVVAACPLSDDNSNIVKMEDAGAGAVVMFSLFEEQIQQQQARTKHLNELNSDGYPEAESYFLDMEEYQSGPYEYLEKIHHAKLRTQLPIIGSINGVTREGWIEYAKLIEEAGADGLELNIYFIPADIATTSEQVEQRYVDIVKAIRQAIRIPLAVKLNPYFSAIGHMARKLNDAGANALVLFNRFYQPDFDIDRLEVQNNLEYSHPGEIRLPLLWLALLHGRLPASLAATSGVNSEKEVIKYLLAGADATMVASALYRYGIDYITVLNTGLRNWMQRMGYQSIESFKGQMSQLNISDPTAYDRANYIKIVGNV